MVGVKLALAAVEATAWGMDGTVNCDKRDTRPPRAGAGAAAGVTGAAGGGGAAEEATAAGFFVDMGAGLSAVWRLAALVVVVMGVSDFLIGAFFAAGAAAADFLAGVLATAALFAAGVALLPAAVLWTTGLGAGLALAASFFTATAPSTCWSCALSFQAPCLEVHCEAEARVLHFVLFCWR